MPRLVTPHQVHFTAEQLARARRVAAARSAPHREVLRAKLTLLLAAQPSVSHAQAARETGLSGHTVYEWRRRWAAGEWSLRYVGQSPVPLPKSCRLGLPR